MSSGEDLYVPLHLVSSIPGWLPNLDYDLFNAVLANQSEPGDLVELGVYQGKSAVVIGAHCRPGETFTVIDLFEDAATDEENRGENNREYEGLSRSQFESNYLRVHDRLPEVITGPSESIVDYASHGAHRFVHIDASHLYAHVVADIEASRTLLAPDGVVVFDDIRSAHTPGVAAAVWAAVAEGLRPFAITGQKLYATWGDPTPWVPVALEVAVGRTHEVQQVADCALVRIEQEQPVWRRWTPEAAQPAVSIARREALARLAWMRRGRKRAVPS